MSNEKEKLGETSAFPVAEPQNAFDYGMSKRFYAACAAMQGLLANPEIIRAMAREAKTANKDLAKAAYETADELLKQENE